MPSNPQDPSQSAQLTDGQPESQPESHPNAPRGDESLFDRPDSPCIGICSTLFDEICQGCGRSAMEVSNWVFMDDAEKLAVWERITREGKGKRFRQG
ncbi:DUF1289 domain-containing protein [Cupriavidus basilensis]|uniref:DUF1289 domain-containing protein n=1 Tax=Cupriavidus basilensis TaxID=68895 RepID=A0A643G2S2_9BURK|nr:DUF1289 domain-containing protein [Cupriavidus basilensis]